MEMKITPIEYLHVYIERIGRFDDEAAHDSFAFPEWEITNRPNGNYYKSSKEPDLCFDEFDRLSFV